MRGMPHSHVGLRAESGLVAQPSFLFLGGEPWI